MWGEVDSGVVERISKRRNRIGTAEPESTRIGTEVAALLDVHVSSSSLTLGLILLRTLCMTCKIHEYCEGTFNQNFRSTPLLVSDFRWGA